MELFFETDRGFTYAKERFREMCGADARSICEGMAVYDKVKQSVCLRAKTRTFFTSIKDGTAELGGTRISCGAISDIQNVKIYAYAMTAGETEINGNALERTLCDIWGTAFTDALTELLRENIAEENKGAYVSKAFGPGFYGIGIDEIKNIFDLVQPEGIGITLTNGYLSPMKSSIGFFIVSDKEMPLPPRDCSNCAGDTGCEFCRNHKRDMVTVTFKNEDVQLSVPKGALIIDAARMAGVVIDAPCSGTGKCGKCLVDIEYGGDIKTVKACAERVYDDTTVITRKNSNQIIVTKLCDKAADEYMIAFDIGTTTLEMRLLSGDTELYKASAINPQTMYAGDVIGRIKHFDDNGNLQKCLLKTINAMILKMAEAACVEPDMITKCAFSGNTVMLYILSGKDPGALGRYPYTVEETFGAWKSAQEIGILTKNAVVYLPPVISAFVGADIVCGIMSTRLLNLEKTLFLDIGTNGEMAIMKNGRLLCASAAAGPALEGAGITFGMRAEKGAVSRFKIVNRNTVMVETIDKSAAVGICGSALTDIIGELVKHGIITADGSFCDKRLIASPIRGRICEYMGETAFRVCAGVYLTQSDIRQFQLAKGAIRAGVEIMSAEAESVIVAGTFGAHMSEESLINSGILPKRFKNHIQFAGNTSLAGAELLLSDNNLQKSAKDIAKNAETAELSKNKEFERLFVKYMNFEQIRS